jgi:hypothetical protein
MRNAQCGRMQTLAMPSRKKKKKSEHTSQMPDAIM